MEEAHVSERTKALENAASRALLDFVREPSEKKADSADNVVWRIAEAVVAKVNENLVGELGAIRRLTMAAQTETTTAAVKRLMRDREGIEKKYRKAREAWDDERQKTTDVVESAIDYLASIEDGHECDEEGPICPRCQLAFALEDLNEAR